MGEMNGMLYWEYKQCEQQTGVLDEEPDASPAAANFTTKKTKGEHADRSGWKGPGKIWISES